jgi:hypothetical protein
MENNIISAQDALVLANENCDKAIPDIMNRIKESASKGMCHTDIDNPSEALIAKLQKLGYAVRLDKFGGLSGYQYKVSWEKSGL